MDGLVYLGTHGSVTLACTIYQSTAADQLHKGYSVPVLDSPVQPGFLSYQAGNPFKESVIPGEIPAGLWPLRTVRTGSGHLFQEHVSCWRKDKSSCHKIKMFGELLKEHNIAGRIQSASWLHVSYSISSHARTHAQ